MVEIIGSIVWWVGATILTFMWWVFTWTYPILIMITILILIYLGLQKLPYEPLIPPKKRVQRLKSQLCFFKNSYGQWTALKPDKANEKIVRDYLTRKKLTVDDL